jgi:hypothetical protein
MLGCGFGSIAPGLLCGSAAMPLTATPDDSAACFRKALLFGFLKTSP